MKKFRSSLKSTSVLMGVSLLLASCATDINESMDGNISAKTEKNINKLTSKSVSEFSGEELFRGIFFANGDFARKLSLYEDAVKQFDSGNMRDQELFEKRYADFVNAVKTNNPAYFDNFKKEVQSGDYFAVQNAIKAGSIEIYSNMAVIFPELGTMIDKLDQDPEVKQIIEKEGEITPEDKQKLTARAQAMMEEVIPCGPTVCAAYFALAVHNTVALTANIGAVAAAYVYLGYKFWGPKLDSYKGGRSLSIADQDYLKFDLLVNEIVEAQ